MSSHDRRRSLHLLALGGAWAVVAIALAACGEPDPATPTPADAATKSDASAVAASLLKPSTSLWLDLSGPTPALRRDKTEVFQLAGAQGVGFREGTAKITHAFGSFLFNEPAQPPWQAVTSWKVTAELPDAATLSGLGADDKALATLAISRSGDAIRLRVTPATTFNRATVAWPCAAGEHFLGLGGQSFDVDHRGHRVALWVEEDGIGKFPEQDAPPVWFLNGKRHQTHTPMPILVSSRGYAVVLRSDHRVVVDLCKTEPDLLRWENWHGHIDLTVIVKADPLELQAALAKELGTPKVLPGFALLAWADAIYGSANVRRIANKLKTGGYPVSVIWSEDWRGGTKTGDDYTLDEDWKADAVLYPDLPQLAKDLHGLGYKFLLYNNTFLTSDADIFPEVTKHLYGVRNPDGTLHTFTGSKLAPASLLDLWNPAARQWAKDVYATGLQAGADGWMADFCEWLPTDAVMADGTLGLDRHQQYAVECQRLNRELFDQWHGKDGVERLYFVRSAWLGSQSEVSVVWAGDQQTDFSQGDGLHSIIPMGIGLGMTGFPYYGSDIAGYASTGTDPATKELFFRWTTLGAFSPVMRTHHGKFAQANWQWEHDADTEAHFLRYTQLHAALWPYLWALANRPELPMLRPLALHHPGFEPGWTRTDQFLLGDRLLVAPVVEKGSTKRVVALPAGTWHPLFSGQATPGGKAVEGPVDVAVEASLTQIPVFVPAGTLLPLLPVAGLRTWSERLTAMPAAQALAQAPLGLEVAVWPGKAPGAAGAYDGAFGALTWDGATWSGACKTATWNGNAVSMAANGTVEVKGDGVLVLDGAGRLTVGPKGNPHTGKGLRIRCHASGL